jgi:GWxTD domain-containing protein
MRTLFLAILSISGLLSSALAQDTTNYAYLYQPQNPLRPLARYAVSKPNSAQVELKIQFKAGNPMAFTYALKPSLVEPTGQKLSARTDESGWLTIALDTADVSENSWVILTPTSQPNNPIPIWLAPVKKFGASPVFPQTQTASTQYLASNEKINIAGPAADTLYVFVYEEAFSSATTPMAAPTPGDMTITQRIVTSQADTLNTTDEGFYFLQADTSGLAGAGVRVVSPYFPQTRRIKNFAGPIRYLSTQEEWNELQRAEFSKEALDRFWFRMTQSQDLARKIIKYYYRGVADANTLFTGFKEGWKTDQGMIYILYGPPSRVTLLPNGDEEWSYAARETIPPITFTFQRTLNPFTEPYFQLVRNRNYARTHYQVINKWRRGTDLE